MPPTDPRDARIAALEAEKAHLLALTQVYRESEDALKLQLMVLHNQAERYRAKFATLEAEVREWLCDKCNIVYPGPPQTSLHCVICPSCGGSTAPRMSVEKRRLEAELAPFRAAAEKYKDACVHLKQAQCCDSALDGLIRAALVENEVLRADGARLAYLADPMGADHSLWQDLMTHTHGTEEFRAKIDAAREKGGG